MKLFIFSPQLKAACLPSHNVLLPPAGVLYLSAEEAFLSAVINYTNSSTVHFKLSPAYILYAAGRFALQRHYRRGSPPSGQTHGVTSIADKMVAMTEKVMQASARKLFLFQVHTLNGWRFKLQKHTVKLKSHLPGVEFIWRRCYICLAEAAGHRRRSLLLDGQLLWAAELPQAWQTPQPAHPAMSAGSVPPGAQGLQVTDNWNCRTHSTSPSTTHQMSPCAKNMSSKVSIQASALLEAPQVSWHQNKPL